MRSLLIAALLMVSCHSKENPVFWGFAMEGFPITKQALISLVNETKIIPEMIVFYLQWGGTVDLIPSLSSINAIGAKPCITWEPMKIVGDKEKVISYEEIINGSYDEYLNSFAKKVTEWNKPLYIRFAHEMNIVRYHWGTEAAGYGPRSPENYVKMFRYVVNFFKERQINNIFWIFCPNVHSIPDEPWNQVSHYYPGDDYVDILGMDGYNWDISPELAKEKNISWTSPWHSFEELFKPLFTELKKIAPNKPIIVFETATVDRGKQTKSRWIHEAIKTAKSWGIEGIVWFHANKEEDWRM